MRKLFLILMTLMAYVLGAQAQNRTYHGTVLGAVDNEPLAGATVMPIGGGKGVATDIEGKFTLSVPASVKQVKVSFIGMKTETVTLTDNMVIKLESSDTTLEEVVAIGYGSAKKLGSVVGSVAVVGEKALANVPTATFVDALQGQVAGLNIYSGSGDPASTGQSVSIRGRNSLTAGTTPLYVLDGAPISSTMFATLNSADIKSIAVLKDAASVAIYGSRAANGVIIITSKKGAYNTDARVNVRANYGISQPVQDGMTMMNTAQYIEFRQKINSPVSQKIVDIANKYGIDTNWRDQIFKSSAPTYSLDASVSGGGSNLSYYFSVNHMDQEGIITQSGMNRTTLRSNIDVKVNDWFRTGVQTNLGLITYEQNGTISSSNIYNNNPMVFARMALPYDAPNYYTFDDNGNIQWGEKALFLHYSGLQHPDFYTNTRNTERSRITLNTNIYEQITPIEGLTLRAQQTIDGYDYRLDNTVYPYDSYLTPMGDKLGNNPAGQLNTGANQQSFTRYYQFTSTNTAEYRFSVADIHNITVLAGQESIYGNSNGFSSYTTGQTDKRQNLLQQGTKATVADQTQSLTTSTFNSLFGKVNYDYDNRYYVVGSYRADGSSKFSPGHKWSSFWSGGVMWNLSGEEFMQDVNWVKEIQLRTNYGTTGNSSIGDYAYFGNVGAFGTGYGDGTVTGATGLSSASNNLLSWETVESFDASAHAKFWNMLSAEVAFYNKYTIDMLMSIPWSYTTGFSEGVGNIGKMRNRGVDVTLNADLYHTRDWMWTARANFNYNQNRIVELFNGRDSYVIPNTGLRYQIGHDSSEMYSVRYAGVDPRDGKQLWLDKNDNLTKVYNEEENSVMTGKCAHAPFTGGFGTFVAYKGFSLNADFSFALGKYMTNNDIYFLRNAKLATSFNQDVEMLNVWTKPGDVTMYPNATEQIQFDTRQIENASFMRLKNLTMSYRFPSNLLKAMQMKNLVLHATARNLWTLTKFSGYDPEPLTNIYKFAYPNTRQYEFGVEFGF